MVSLGVMPRLRIFCLLDEMAQLALHGRRITSLTVANQHYGYFGERASACVFISRLCFSTTRHNSRSIVLKASWMTLFSG
jgi:hypothetical protein